MKKQNFGIGMFATTHTQVLKCSVFCTKKTQNSAARILIKAMSKRNTTQTCYAINKHRLFLMELPSMDSWVAPIGENSMLYMAAVATYRDKEHAGF